MEHQFPQLATLDQKHCHSMLKMIFKYSIMKCNVHKIRRRKLMKFILSYEDRQFRTNLLKQEMCTVAKNKKNKMTVF